MKLVIRHVYAKMVSHEIVMVNVKYVKEQIRFTIKRNVFVLQILLLIMEFVNATKIISLILVLDVIVQLIEMFQMDVHALQIQMIMIMMDFAHVR